MTNLAVLASGTGSLFEAMLDSQIPVKLMVADRECNALKIAETRGVPFALIPRTFGKGFDRISYTNAVIKILRRNNIDLVAMAGFMTVLGEPMFQDGGYPLKILNTHPSLLPAFQGHHAVHDTIAYGVKISGCTVHFVTEELDAGPILAQESVVVHSSDTKESLHERIKGVERVLYPLIIRKLLNQ